MNIVFISSQPYPYGMAATKRIRFFAEYLAKTHAVKAIVVGSNNGVNEESGMKDNVLWSFKKFSRIETFVKWGRIKHILKENKHQTLENILFLYDGIGLTNVVFAHFARKFGYLIVTDIVEDYSVHEENTGKLLTWLHKINRVFDKKIGYFVDGIIVISRRLLNKYYIIDDSLKTILIPVSAENIDMVFVNKTKNNFFTFVYSGSYGVKDGVSFLIASFRILKQKYHDIELILSGKINTEIKTQIDNEKNIKYIGMVPDDEYYQFLSNADVLCMTRIDSRYAHSGFPFKLGEYLATGVPVIVTNVSDINDYLIDGENALIAEPSNVNSLSAKMEYAYLNQKIIENLGLKGKEIARVHFNKDLNGEKLEQFLFKL